MLDQPDAHPDKLAVEVAVRCGEINSVTLTTILELDDWKDNPAQARGRISATLDLLVKALPLAMMRGLDADYNAQVRDVCLNGKGEMEYVPHELRQAAQEQQELKKRIKLDPPETEADQ